MKGRKKNLLPTLLIIGILILSIFFMITQYQLSELSKDEKDGVPLFVKIFSNETSVIIPHGIKFTSLVTNYEGNVQYFWDFGDGDSSEEINPTHVYSENGTHVCVLTVSDSSGEQKSDSVDIVAKENEKPMVSIKINDANAIRDYIPVLPKLSDPMGGKKLWRILKFNLVPSSWLEIEGPVHCDAQVNDPEGDEIISYKWVLTQPTVTTASGTKQPKHEFEGESVTFPLLYTYGSGQYNVELTVEDSAGKNSTVNIPFKIDRSSLEVVSKYLIKDVIIGIVVNTIYDQYLSPQQQALISEFLWEHIFGPIDSGLFNFINKTIFPLLPENLQEKVLELYYSAWGFVDNKFPKPAEKVILDYSNITEFDFSDNVESDGSVLTQTSISKSFLITNNDKENTAKNVYLMLKNPDSNINGLAEGLNTENIEITVRNGGLSKKLLYNNKYFSFHLADKINSKETYDVDIIITLKEADAGSFEKRNYECDFFVYQQNAKHVDEISFTVIL